MDIKKLQALVIDALEDVKAQEIAVFDTSHLTALFDRVVIASGTSNRQTKALAASVRDKVKAAGGTVVSMEGEGTGEWVLVDLGDMIVHIMQPAIRAYYRLEEIWGDKPVKFGAAKRASKAVTAEAEAKPRRRHIVGAVGETTEAAAPTAARKTAARKTPATAEGGAARAETATAIKTARKTAPKTAVKTAAKTATKTAAKTAAKSSAPRKTAAKKPPVGRTVKVSISKSASAGKAAAKRAAER
ncbi:ribosome silencing factor [Lacisediminimonas profundi]|uniref:ribosome silencing factor n=1 Tax=Lacisediminimonas profundi TaxID=2603856 RepID=UPI00124B4F8D|nr:ribosome silencing factor [Lacisediminimonas profundi]